MKITRTAGTAGKHATSLGARDRNLRSRRRCAAASAQPSIPRRELLGSVCFLLGSIVGSPSYSQPARTSQDIQREYDRYSETYDDLDGGAAADAFGFTQMRRDILSQAVGDVLEVGVGTGLNLPLYPWSGGSVRSLTAVDISEGMLQQAQARTTSSTLGPVSFVQADVTQLPFDSSSFDSVVDTFSLCVYPDPAEAVRQMARVLRPGGRLLLAAHVRSSNPLLGAYQDFTSSAVAASGKGCVWNQDVERMVRDAGLQVQSVEPRLAGVLALIVAVKPGV